jgi:hypothetical protein
VKQIEAARIKDVERPLLPTSAVATADRKHENNPMHSSHASKINALLARTTRIRILRILFDASGKTLA